MTDKILIYGGSGGIGSAIARRIVGRGAQAHLVARDADRLRALAEEIGAGCTAGDVEDAETFARAAREAGAPLAGLVYAVGTINLKSFAQLSDADFERDFRVNALGAARAVRSALPDLSDGASILLFSTVAVRQGFTAHASVSMAKGAVEGLVAALGAELAPKVRVNAIAPSLVETPLASTLTRAPQMAKAIAAMHAIPRLGTSQDVAALADFLLSSDAGWITGQTFGVDGGRSTLRTKG